MSKKCWLCVEKKPLTEFWKRKDGYEYRCKESRYVKRKICCYFDLGYIYWQYSNGFTEKIGSKAANGYLIFGLNGKNVLVHRYLYEQYYNVVLKPDQYIDHINRVKTDNKIDNLRVVTRHQNSQNITHRENVSSKFKGVCWNKERKKWRAYIWYNNKTMYLGLFDDEIDAAKAYNEKAIELNKKYNCIYTLNIF